VTSAFARLPAFSDAIDDALTSLRDHTCVPNWVLTRNHSDGVVVLGAASSAKAKAAKGRGALYRQRPFPVLTAEVFDERSTIPFGTIIGFVTEGDIKDVQNEIAELVKKAERSRPLVDLMASMLTSLLFNERRVADDVRHTEMVAYADLDPLTGLHERAAWLRLIELEGVRLSRFEDDAVIVLVDVPDLHRVTATNGFEAGNELLREIAHTMRTALPKNRILARLRSDEFGLLLYGPNPAHQLLDLRHAFANTGLTVSLGVGQRRAGESTLIPAIERADRSMGASRDLGVGVFARS
jgi:diguanylate cyclase (GGDEF)-like protein